MNGKPIRDIKLLIFDVDGTIASYKSNDLWVMPMRFFENIYLMQHKPFIALATNQGGVGMRYWMESKEWGDPTAYPSEDDVRQRMHLISEKVRRISGVEKVSTYMAFMYLSSNENWSPMKANKPEWQKSSRKPGPGMLIRAMTEYSMLGEQTLMVGDSDDDKGAAKRAGCHFISTEQFFFSEKTLGALNFDPLSVL